MSSIWLQLAHSGVITEKQKVLFTEFDHISPVAEEIINLLDSGEVTHPNIIEILNQILHEMMANKGTTLEKFLKKSYLNRNKKG